MKKFSTIALPKSLLGSVNISVAIDAEFLKVDGEVFARSVAFIPFVVGASGGSGGGAIPATTANKASSTTTKDETWNLQLPPATVVNMTSTSIFETADIVPCGHAIDASLQKLCARGEALHCSPSEPHAIPGLPPTTKGSVNNNTVEMDEDRHFSFLKPETDGDSTVTGDFFFPDLFQSEDILPAHQQEEDEVIPTDPYTVPNPLKWEGVLKAALTMATSNDIDHPLAELHHALKPHGAGFKSSGRIKKRGLPLLNKLVEILDELGNAKGAEAQTMLQWSGAVDALHQLQRCSASEMDRIANECLNAAQDGAAGLDVPKTLLQPNIDSDLDPNLDGPSGLFNENLQLPLEYTEANTMDDFSKALSKTWKAYMHCNDHVLKAELATIGGGGSAARRVDPWSTRGGCFNGGSTTRAAKLLNGSPCHRTIFYGYGTEDQRVVRASIARALPKPVLNTTGNVAAVSVPRNAHLYLKNEMEVVVNDITSSTMFKHAGLRQGRRTPSLVNCLQTVARGTESQNLTNTLRGSAARQLLVSSAVANHNPLWDALALAAIASALVPSPLDVKAKKMAAVAAVVRSG